MKRPIVARTLYANREEAGRILAEAIKRDLGDIFSSERPLVLAIPRGGVILGRDVAKALGADLDIVVPRKLGAPMEPELALGAVMHDGTTYLSEDIIRSTGTDGEYLKSEKARQEEEAKRRLRAYRRWSPEARIAGRVVILVDDGIATGATMIVALRWIRSRGARLIVAAAPLAPSSALTSIKDEADRVICPHSPEPFNAIGMFYDEFQQVTDDQVRKALEGP
jgi:putative phosphoribosyl transferase